LHLRHLAVALLLVLAPRAAAGADADATGEPAGHVRTTTGTVQLVRAGVIMVARVGDPVLADDVIETGADSSIGITFRDDCRISLGPQSRVHLNIYEFAPAVRSYAFVLRFTQGTLQYISGLIAKLAPAAVLIETPNGSIAVRGTRLLARIASP
jgi:hypothetical protein